MKKEMLQENEELIRQLNQVPVLQSFAKKDIRNILNFSKIRKYCAGELIIAEGSYDNWVFILISGEVSVIKHGSEIDKLRRTGDIFGEMCVIDGSPRSATIKAATDCACLATDVSFMDNLFSDDKIAFCAVFYQVIAEVLVYRLRETSAELVKSQEELARYKSCGRVL
jgi:CRP/FNR family transcriptional regulator, cyclic AMP receptor protein